VTLQIGIVTVVGLLAAALVIGIVAERLRLPYSVALVLASVAVSIPGAPQHFAPSLLFVFLPALIFEAAWNLDAAALRRRWLPIAVLALPGVLLTIAFVGAGLAFFGQMPLLSAILLGTILAATDPIAVIPIFRRLAVPEDLATIVEGESLFNDGAAIVLYGALVAALVAGATTLAPGPIALGIVGVSLGGAAIGFVAAALVALVLRGSREVSLELVGTVVAAYGGYLAADALHVSGIFAALVAGIALRAFMHVSPSVEAGAAVDSFWSAIAFFATSILFLLMGLAISLPRIWHEPLLVGCTLGLIVAARLVLVYLGLPLAGIGGVRSAWQHVIALAGMRGALPVALALALPEATPHRAEIIDVVYGVVLITLVAQGLGIGPLVTRLRPRL
jgi:CPA1 family monovalent cation:H+ antiporter